MSELPLSDGWIEAKLGDLIQFNYGKSLPAPTRSGHGFPVYGSNGIVGYHTEALTNGETLIVGRKGSVGEITHSLGPCSPIDTTYYIDQFNGMPPKYLYYLLKYLRLDELNKATAIPGINREDAYQVPVPLAPLAEQKRIADKLDALLARVDGCRARLGRVPVILKRFRQAVLAAATSGALTAEWREGKGVLEDWQTVLLGEISNEVKNGFPFKPNDNPPGIPILRISSVRSFSINYQDIRYIPPDTSVAMYSLREGDLLFTRYNGSISFVGICAQVKRLPFAQLVHPDKLIRVRVNRDYTIPGYVEIAANSPQARSAIERSAKTSAGQTGISGQDLKNLHIPLPGIAEQHEIVRRVETLFGYADRLEARYRAAAARVDRLTPALLAKAFRGELVAQDPADEPAAQLLARVQAVRDTR